MKKKYRSFEDIGLALIAIGLLGIAILEGLGTFQYLLPFPNPNYQQAVPGMIKTFGFGILGLITGLIAMGGKFKWT